MKKTKKIIISVVASIIILALGIFIYYKFIYDSNKLNLTEKDWLNNHRSSVISFNLPNDLNVFAASGQGVYYDFLNSLEKEYEININKNVIPKDSVNGLGFAINNKITDKDLLLYKDHYVIVAKEQFELKSITDINGKNIGSLTDDVVKLTSNKKLNALFTTADSKEELLESFKNNKVNFLFVPLNEYIDEILKNDYKIVYHFDDLINYYYINLGEDKTLNSIIKKYYNGWIKNKYKDSFYENNYQLFINSLNITQLETDTLSDRNYVYGFVEKTPYHNLSSSKYGGIIISYLEEFSRFSGADFTYTKFKNYAELVKAFNKGKVDLMLYDNALVTNGIDIKTNINDNYYIISPLSNAFKVSNLDGFDNQTIYVVKDSKLSAYLSGYKNIKLKYVKNEKELFKKTKSNEVIALSSLTYDYEKNKSIKDYQIVYEGNNNNYTFKYQNATDVFYRLFNNYVNYLSNYEMTNNGILDFAKAESKGNFISLVAKYILLLFSIIVVAIAVFVASRRNIKINTKIRKDEKLKFIDILTSLKNRNYLNERIPIWNQNTIYPQSIIVIDLNNIKYLNDTFGHEEGDKQIKAAANILLQTQLDNTEIIRTDGNEFMIYMVGYSEKQVLNYMKKLIKEFNDLPYEYGAAFGFSMIVDDLKLLDDAINEATIQMRENKEIENEKTSNKN